MKHKDLRKDPCAIQDKENMDALCAFGVEGTWLETKIDLKHFDNWLRTISGPDQHNPAFVILSQPCPYAVGDTIHLAQ